MSAKDRAWAEFCRDDVKLQNNRDKAIFMAGWKTSHGYYCEDVNNPEQESEIRKRTMPYTRINYQITDGMGSYWPAYCECGAPMEVVRPGKCQCTGSCEYEKS